MPVTVEPGTALQFDVELANHSSEVLASLMPHPVHVGHRWRPAEGGDSIEGERAVLPRPLHPGATVVLHTDGDRTIGGHVVAGRHGVAGIRRLGTTTSSLRCWRWRASTCRAGAVPAEPRPAPSRPSAGGHVSDTGRADDAHPRGRRGHARIRRRPDSGRPGVRRLIRPPPHGARGRTRSGHHHRGPRRLCPPRGRAGGQ